MKNNRNTAIAVFVINIIIFLVLLILILFHFYPEIVKIEEMKEDIKTYKENYNEIVTKWLEYSDFKKVRGVSISNYQKKILTKIDQDFYNKNFINNWSEFKTYDEFLKNLDEKIKGDLKEKYDEKHDKIYNIMPIYVDSVSWNVASEWTMSDFKFVNLVENLLYKYNLTTTSPIWISDIQKVKEYSNTKNNSDLWSDIYKITLPLKIEWKKKKIISFIEQINKMWKVHKTENNHWVMELVIDDNSNFIEVDNIKMDEYIDSSPFILPSDKDKSLIDILKASDQKNEIFNIELELVFYVQWLANYKIKEEVLNVLGKLDANLDKENREKLARTNYNEVKKRLQTLKWKNKWDQLALRQLNEIDIYLKWISPKVSAILKDVSSWKKLLESFNKAEKYKGIFAIISAKLDTFDKTKTNNNN